MDVEEVPSPLASFAAVDGSDIAPLVDGNPTFRRLAQLLDAAQDSFWVTVSFIEEGWRHPDTGATFMDWLNAAADRGVDVRVLFWRLERYNAVLCRPPRGAAGFDSFGTMEDLVAGCRFKVRFDSSGSDHRHCHHEKSWVIDGSTAEPVAVTGGVVITPSELSEPGHPSLQSTKPGHEKHDVNVEVRGRAARDVASSFVERWNAAQGHERPRWHFPDLVSAGPLAPPPTARPHSNNLRAQVLRTVRPGQLPTRPEGESSILEAYRRAIAGARRTIYIENQHTAHATLLQALLNACERGVVVTYLAPAVALSEWGTKIPWTARALEGLLGSPVATPLLMGVSFLQRAFAPPAVATTLGGSDQPTPSYRKAFTDILPRLAAHPNFVYAGLLQRTADGVRSVYVHSKLIIVDDEFLLAGSANLVDLSLERDHTELAVSCWGATAACAMRDALFREHTATDVPMEEGAEATHRRLQGIARDNASRLGTGEALQGMLTAMDGQLTGNGLYAVSLGFNHMTRKGCGRELTY